MTILKIIQVPDPIIRIKSQKLEQFDEKFKAFMEDMLETMYKIEGAIGIAAIQVGQPVQALIVDFPIKQGAVIERKPYFIVNPVITYLSEEKIILPEACLSVPKEGEKIISSDIERPISIAIEYQDLEGNERKLSIDGTRSDYDKWIARCLQHEIDHLGGILFTDKIFEYCC